MYSTILPLSCPSTPLSAELGNKTVIYTEDRLINIMYQYYVMDGYSGGLLINLKILRLYLVLFVA